MSNPAVERTIALRPQARRLRVARYSKNFGYAPKTWQRALQAIDFDADAELLKRTHRSSVWRARVLLPNNPRHAVLKCQTLTSGGRVKSFLRRSKAHRQWHGARLLARSGVPFARPMVILQTKPPPRVRRRGVRAALVREAPPVYRTLETLILEHVPGPTVLEYLASEHNSLAAEHWADRAVAEAVGVLLRRYIAQGLVNRDGKPSNLVITGLERHGARLAVIDSVAMSRRRVGNSDLHRMLADLLLEPIGCGCPPSLTARARVLRAAGLKRRARRAAWRAVAGLIEQHGDATPADDPLVRV